MSEDEFSLAASRVRPFADFLYFHLMGEPLLHPKLDRFLEIAKELSFRAILTTNGTLLKKRENTLLSSPALYKVSISLHSYEANEVCFSLEDYLEDCFSFCKKGAEAGIICVMRLWNLGGEECKRNERILSLMHERFPGEWKETYSGFRITDKVFLEWGERFDWPDIDAEEISTHHTCYGLRDQIGILCDGTVVPCCLDAEGAVPLGNIYVSSVEDILSSERAVKLRESLIKRDVKEPLCRRCGFAKQKGFK